MSSNDYLDQLGTALSQAGIRGPRRARILTEFADHLASDPEADLGDPRGIATQFADELGTSWARGAAFTAFAALAVIGVLLVVRLLAMGPFNRVNGSVGDTLGILAAVMAAQIAFVAGTLAFIRALRLRRMATIPAAEARILARRAGVGLLAGVLATVAVPLRAAASPGASAGSPWWSVATIAGALLVAALALPALLRAVRLRPRAGGDPGNLLDDFGPLRPLASTLTGSSPNRFALLSATGLAAVIALAGVLASDPYDGILRGLVEALVYLGCYAVLGGYLGLRTPALGAPPAPRID